jgi:hypothetical protein
MQRERKRKLGNLPIEQPTHRTKMEVADYIDSWRRPHEPLDPTPTTYELLRRICTCTEKSSKGSLTHFLTANTEWAHFCGNTCVDLWRQYLEKCQKMHIANVEKTFTEQEKDSLVKCHSRPYGKIKPTKATHITRKRKLED